MVIRKMMDWVFSQHDLAWLDDLLPEKEKKKKDEDKKKGKEKDKDKDKEKKKPKAEYSDEEVWNSCPVLLAPCRDETSLKECLIFVCSASVCVCVFAHRRSTTPAPTTPPAQTLTWIAGTVFSNYTYPTKTLSTQM